MTLVPAATETLYSAILAAAFDALEADSFYSGLCGCTWLDGQPLDCVADCPDPLNL